MANSGLGWLNDLWTFDLKDRQWTWMSGESAINSLGFYGNASESYQHMPRSRAGASMSFDEENRLLFVFGGNGAASGRTKKIQ